MYGGIHRGLSQTHGLIPGSPGQGLKWLRLACRSSAARWPRLHGIWSSLSASMHQGERASRGEGGWVKEWYCRMEAHYSRWHSESLICDGLIVWTWSFDAVDMLGNFLHATTTFANRHYNMRFHSCGRRLPSTQRTCDAARRNHQLACSMSNEKANPPRDDRWSSSHAKRFASLLFPALRRRITGRLFSDGTLHCSARACTAQLLCCWSGLAFDPSAPSQHAWRQYLSSNCSSTAPP